MVPGSVREPCARLPLPDPNDTALHAPPGWMDRDLQQEAALARCDAQRAAAVALLDRVAALLDAPDQRGGKAR